MTSKFLQGHQRTSDGRFLIVWEWKNNTAILTLLLWNRFLFMYQAAFSVILLFIRPICVIFVCRWR